MDDDGGQDDNSNETDNEGNNGEEEPSLESQPSSQVDSQESQPLSPGDLDTKPVGDDFSDDMQEDLPWDEPAPLDGKRVETEVMEDVPTPVEQGMGELTPVQGQVSLVLEDQSMG